MKVLMINTERTRGGAARMATTLIEDMNIGDGEVLATLIHCGDNEVSPGFIGIKRPHAYYLNILQTRLLGNHRIYDFGVSDQILKYIANNKIDVIHLHNLHGYYLNFVNLLRNIRDMPIVWTWHDMWGATGRCGFSMECDKWISVCKTCNHMDYYPKVWIDNAESEYFIKSKLISDCKNLHIVSPSGWLRDIAIKRGIEPEYTHLIPNPVDLSKYSPQNKSEAKRTLGLSNSPVALFVAHNCNDERKRYYDFEQVVSAANIKGVVVGVPPEHKNPDLIYLGKYTEAEKLAVAYSASDVFVITSQSDNYPNTVIESMACGTPVFGYKIGGIPSQMPVQWDGLVDYLDIRALATNIAVYFNGKNTDKWQASVREHAVKNWDPIRVAQRYVELYKAIIH